VCCIGGPKISTQQSAKEFMRKTILLIVITDLELLWQYRVSIVQLIEIMTNIYSFLIVTGNQENLLQLRQQLILDKSSAKKNANELRGTKQKTRRSLVYPEGDNTQEASFPEVAKKSKPNPAEKQLAKVKHLSLMFLRVILPFCALLIVTCFNSSHAVGNVFMVS
jgi:hypothetical protein